MRRWPIELADPHPDTNANPTRHYADVWLCLRRVTACRRVLGWAFTPGANGDATRSLAADIRKGKRAAWFMVTMALG